ncbi:hypothetical protein [Thermomonas sp.]|uniref:hypothetical protein n=1 Tax=Thermomonas sp. TaxID=1971895 RepID=UPI002488F618|nr:hypothetical protein [Thermomonas sp.]MDI1254122.1 hypothetical protein [Thermomonas sp.]
MLLEDSEGVPQKGRTKYVRWFGITAVDATHALDGYFFVSGEIALGLIRDQGLWESEIVLYIDPVRDVWSGFYCRIEKDLITSDLWFLAADLDAASRMKVTDEPAKPARIRADREENLLRVIAGLWALSGLPAEHNTTADKLSALFDSWGWDRPAKSSMADTILRHAAKLSGAVIRTSD